MREIEQRTHHQVTPTKRISKACDQCRSRKVKCDGYKLCSRCKKQHIACTYEYIHKNKLDGTDSKSKNHPILKRARIDNINETSLNRAGDNQIILDRLGKIESMVEHILHHLNEPTTENSESFENDQYGQARSTKPDLKLTENHMFENDKTNKPSLQSTAFLLSPGAIQWLKVNGKNEKLDCLTTVLKFTKTLETYSLYEWVDPIDRNDLSSLPSREMISLLLDCVEYITFPIKMLDIDYINKALNVYCDYRDGNIKSLYMTYSDMFLVNAYLLLLSSCMIKVVSSKSTSKLLPNIQQLIKIEKQLFDNTIFYFHRVSAISDGVGSIYGCILLAWYADNVKFSKAGYMISLVAIRQAQQRGLNMNESYSGFSDTETKKYSNMWWLCYSIHYLMCLKTGNLPMIKDDDITAPELPQLASSWNFKNKFNDFRDLTSISNVISSREKLIDEDLDELIMQIEVDFSAVLSNILNYFTIDSTRFNGIEDIMKTKSIVLQELECWKDRIPEIIRPSLNFDKDFSKKIKEISIRGSCKGCYAFTLWSTYYNHILLVINRFISAFLLNFNGDIVKESLQAFDAARVILKISIFIKHWPEFDANIFTAYIFNAVLSICYYYLGPNSSLLNFEVDIELLLKVWKDYFIPLREKNRKIVNSWNYSAIIMCFLYLIKEKAFELGVNKNIEYLISELKNITDPVDEFYMNKKNIISFVFENEQNYNSIFGDSRQFAKIPINSKKSKIQIPVKNRNNENTINEDILSLSTENISKESNLGLEIEQIWPYPPGIGDIDLQDFGNFFTDNLFNI